VADVPFELPGEIPGAGAVAEACHVEGGTPTARHDGGWEMELEGRRLAEADGWGVGERKGRSERDVGWSGWSRGSCKGS
jgi:hypothetical protein